MPVKRHHIAKFIKNFVKDRTGGRSRRAVARALDVDEAAIRSWENPEGPTPRLELIYRFCETFNVSLWDLLGEQDAMVQEIEELSRRVEDLEQRLGAVQRLISPPNEQTGERPA